MGRKYAVWVGGKPVEIHTEAPPVAVREHWLVVNARNGQELRDAAAATARPEVQGVLLYSTHGLDAWAAFGAHFRFVQAAGGAVQDERGRLLVIRRLGLWDLPKGKLDEGEPVEAAALREVREECGLKELRIVRPLLATWHTYERKGHDHLKRTDWFLMQGSARDPLVPQLDEDITDVRWMERGELSAVRSETYPSLMQVLDAFEAAEPAAP